MTLFVSSAAGSRDLVPHLQAHDVPVVCCRVDNGDIEFLGSTGAGPSIIGVEHKNAVTSDIFTSMQDGRLSGEQLRKMVNAYQWRRYLIIEGNLRRSSRDGILEIFKYDRDVGKYTWQQAFSRNGKGWTYEEFENRIDSIQEFFSYPHAPGLTVVKRTYDAVESAAYVASRFKYWSKPYEDHSSHRQQHTGRDLPPMDPMIPSSETDLTQLWAADIDGIGPKKSTFVARHFRSPLGLANGSEQDWLAVKMLESRKGQHALLEKHFSIDTVRKIRQQIGHEYELKDGGSAQ